MQQTFSLVIFCSYWHIMFLSGMLPKAGQFGSLSNREKEAYARLCKNIVKMQLSQYPRGSVSHFRGLPLTFGLLLSAINLKYS